MITSTSLTLTLIIIPVLIIFYTAHDPLSVSVGFAILGCVTTWKLVPALEETFKKKNLKGRDLAKVDKREM